MEKAILAATTPMVRLWMNWMMFIFMVSIVFIWKYAGARFALVAFLLTLPLAIGIFKLTQNPHLIGIAHLLVWCPLAVYLLKTEYQRLNFNFKQSYQALYSAWLVLLLITIAISSVFDIRDIILISLGRK